MAFDIKAKERKRGETQHKAEFLSSIKDMFLVKESSKTSFMYSHLAKLFFSSKTGFGISEN